MHSADKHFEAGLQDLERLAHKDVGRLEVSVQDGRLQSVQVQHAPGYGPHPAGQLEGVQLALGCAVQQQVQRALGAVLCHQYQAVIPPADAPQSYDIVMGACTRGQEG